MPPGERGNAVNSDKLQLVAAFRGPMPTGVAVSKSNRVFVNFPRWGDPDHTGTWGQHPFGGEVTAYRTFDGLTIPSAGRFGWFFGTDRWSDGEFFRYQITTLQPRLMG